MTCVSNALRAFLTANPIRNMGHGKAWTDSDDADLKRLLGHEVGYAACARTLNRSVLAVRLRAMKLRRRTSRGGPQGTGEVETRSSPVPHADAAVQLGPIAFAEVREQALPISKASVPEDYDPNVADFYGRILRPTVYTCSNCGGERLPGHRCGPMGRH